MVETVRMLSEVEKDSKSDVASNEVFEDLNQFMLVLVRMNPGLPVRTSAGRQPSSAIFGIEQVSCGGSGCSGGVKPQY